MTKTETPHTAEPGAEGQRWAWIGGASDGLGYAFAEACAQRGFNLLLFARRGAALADAAEGLRARYGIAVSPQKLDLGDPAIDDVFDRMVRAHPPSLAIYNAAWAPAGEFLSMDSASLKQLTAVNVRGPLLWALHCGRAMAGAGRGTLILMSSLAGEQGSPRIAAYAASKAFNTILAEGLWAELKAANVRVLSCVAGAIDTPGLRAVASQPAPGTLPAAVIAEQTLAQCERPGRTHPRFTPGWLNRVSALLLGRWLPRRLAIRTMSRATAKLAVAQPSERPG